MGKASPRILIVGGTRFIGARVTRRLHAAGADVTVFHRGQHHHPALPAVRHVVDPGAGYPVCAFPAEIARARWDVVVHMTLMGEADGRAAVDAFAGRAGHLVMVSSGDVYRAYGRLTGLEPGLPDPVPIDEDAPTRTVWYPYRDKVSELGDLARQYEKLAAEGVVRASSLAATILRLAKLYGPEENADLATVYGFAAVPHWRWTHVHVDNAAAAIVAAALAPAAAGRVYNVGEETTPTMGERLAALPPASRPPATPPPFDYAQSLALDTGRIRRELGFADVVDECGAMVELAAAT